MAGFCARCEHSGFLVDEVTNTAVPCECRARVLRQRRAGRMVRSVPRRFAHVSFESDPVCFFEEAVLVRLKAYVRDFDRRVREGRGLWLGGSAGTGKTSAAALLVKEASARGYTAGFHPVPELLMRIRDSFNQRPPDDVYSEEREQNLIDRLSDLDLLVLDDLGAVKATPWVMQQIYVIVNRRYNDARSTIVTTDLDREELATIYGWRVVSRLIEMTGRQIVFRGPDMRVRADRAAEVDDPDEQLFAA